MLTTGPKVELLDKMKIRTMKDMTGIKQRRGEGRTKKRFPLFDKYSS